MAGSSKIDGAVCADGTVGIFGDTGAGAEMLPERACGIGAAVGAATACVGEPAGLIPAKTGSIFDPARPAIVGGAIELETGKRPFVGPPLAASNIIALLAALPVFKFAIVFSVTPSITLPIYPASREIVGCARRPACVPTSAAKPAPGCNCKIAPAIFNLFSLESFGLRPAPISFNLFQAMVLVCDHCSGENIEGFGASALASCCAIISAPTFSWAASKRAFSSGVNFMFCFEAPDNSGSFRAGFLAATPVSDAVPRGGDDDRLRAVIAGFSIAMGLPSNGCVANRAVGTSFPKRAAGLVIGFFDTIPGNCLPWGTSRCVNSPGFMGLLLKALDASRAPEAIRKASLGFVAMVLTAKPTSLAIGFRYLNPDRNVPCIADLANGAPTSAESKAIFALVATGSNAFSFATFGLPVYPELSVKLFPRDAVPPIRELPAALIPDPTPLANWKRVGLSFPRSLPASPKLYFASFPKRSAIFP